MTKTVAFFSGYYLPHFGGIERYTYNVAIRLRKKGYNIIVVTSQENNQKDEEIIDGVKVYRLPIRKIWQERYPFFKKNQHYKQLLQKIREEKIDYYVCNTRFQLPALLGTQLAKENNKKALVLEHGTTYLTLNNKFLDFFLHKVEKILIQRVKKNTDIFYGVSQEAADWLKEFNINSKGVLYNAVDPAEFDKYFTQKTKPDKITISFSGRLQATFKGVEILLSAFEQLSKEYNNVELIIAGDGPIYKKMTQRYQQENIKFLGYIHHDKVMELNNQSDIFVLLSKIEGFSTSMIEAAMMKNVVITTDVGGAYELLPDSTYGYVIENSEEALLKALRDLINHPEKIRPIQEKVSQRVMEKYTWNKTVENFEKAFIELESCTQLLER
ncbi:glycosyltransferase family 4 protein [Lactococcus nasutitermitis]|uniref:Glycosyltransferase family 4 protein n=1 Tax=Lactococcus nasutitermitis TaxID=1652957 RepID=A0ABV9JE97_9LACT|nr:glycosyltransferase family 4 protein [Lactococcus nasutitermitis]